LAEGEKKEKKGAKNGSKGEWKQLFDKRDGEWELDERVVIRGGTYILGVKLQKGGTRGAEKPSCPKNGNIRPKKNCMSGKKESWSKPNGTRKSTGKRAGGVHPLLLNKSRKKKLASQTGGDARLQRGGRRAVEKGEEEFGDGGLNLRRTRKASNQ